MKKLLGIVILGLLLSGSAYAEIYKCEIHINHSFVIKAKKMDEQALGSLETETGKFTDKSTMFAVGITIGEMIEFKGDKTYEREIMVLNNPEKKSPMSFRAIYFDGFGYPYVNTIRIDYWDEDRPIYFYNDWTNEITKGTCQ